ncbi:hypothetical protein LINGRAHAP2_LOCUS26874 [Linum grandiflorum]
MYKIWAELITYGPMVLGFPPQQRMSTVDVYADQLIGSVTLSPDHKKQRIESFDFKDENMWGVVYGCAQHCVKVGLMNFRSDE